MTAPLTVTRLLQNPLGGPAPDGAVGDLVRINDDITAIYLTPVEYERATDTDLRYLLAERAHPHPNTPQERT